MKPALLAKRDKTLNAVRSPNINYHKHATHYCPSMLDSVDGGGFIDPNSEPAPLCPRLLPGRWKPRCDEELLGLLDDCVSFVFVKSPNRENMPFFFCGFTSSSSSPTSSKCSSSIGSDLSNPLAYTAEGDVTREKRESRDVREGNVSL